MNLISLIQLSEILRVKLTEIHTYKKKPFFLLTKIKTNKINLYDWKSFSIKKKSTIIRLLSFFSQKKKKQKKKSSQLKKLLLYIGHTFLQSKYFLLDHTYIKNTFYNGHTSFQIELDLLLIIIIIYIYIYMRERERERERERTYHYHDFIKVDLLK